MQRLHFEDFIAWSALSEASLTVSPEDAASFAAAFGSGAAWPDEEGGQRPLAGWPVAALGMRRLFDAFLHRTAGLGGPGIEAVTWPHPVRGGDTLRFSATVAGARVSASRPHMGLVTLAIAVLNREAACVMTQENAVMVARRRGGARRDGAEARA